MTSDIMQRGHATTRLIFTPDGQVASHCFEWGYEEYRRYEPLRGCYGVFGERLTIHWAPVSRGLLARAVSELLGLGNPGHAEAVEVP